MEIGIEVKLSDKEHSLISGALLARIKATKENAAECREDASCAEHWENAAREYQAVYDKLLDAYEEAVKQRVREKYGDVGQR
jgi:hypothetical protein|nr:MAG TPA_asm: hypothetical protein [Caudoviricetes sp.]